MSDPEDRREDHEGDDPHDDQGQGQQGSGQQGSGQQGSGQQGSGQQGPTDPWAALLGSLGLPLTPGGAPSAGGTPGFPNPGLDLSALLQQFGAMGLGFPGSATPGLSSAGVPPKDPDDWGWLKDMVRQMSAALGPDPSPTDGQRRQLADAVRLAEMWLDEVVDFPAVSGTPAVWSRAEWIEHTFPSWRPLAEPVIKALAQSLGHVPAEADSSDPLGMITQMLAPLMENLARNMYGAQFAQALATLSTQVVSTSDVGFQVAEPRVALLASNVEKHFGGLDLEANDIWLYLALREAARQRLFTQVAWLAPQLQALVQHYARETRIDTSALEESLDFGDMTQIDPARLSQIGEELQGKLFDPEPTLEQVEIRDRLHTLLVLVEGWVEHVVSRAARRWMPSESALSEAVRRRRGAGGPSVDVLKALVGLELKPRRVRDAATLWAALEERRGAGERDKAWAHPDLLPTAGDLDDPLGYADAETASEEPEDEWDRGLEQLLREEGGD